MRRPIPRLSESNLLVLLAVAIGLAGGLSAVGLQKLLAFFHFAFFWLADHPFRFLGRFSVAAAPVAGALVAGPLVYRLAIEAKGHGVPEVMESVALRGGRIRARVAVVKALASAVTIGSGGSAGREGPIVQIGATLGSTIAQRFAMSDRRTRTLVAAGAASGIAAAFNAPLAGVFFALEVILQRFSSAGFATVVLAAVTSSTVWRAFFGNAPVLRVPQFTLANPVELVFYAGLGAAAALVAVGFVATLYRLEDAFDGMRRFPADARPALGAIVVGLLGAWNVLVLGSGIEGIDAALAGGLAIATVLLLLVAKLLATSFTLGSGASGGVFSPSLFMGAMLGSAYGAMLHGLFPGVVAQPGAYALVGMAAVFAAAAQAPISSILIVFEMTNDFRIMVPLMLACITATVLYSRLKRDSVYTAKLRRRGVMLDEGREAHLLETIAVSRAIDREYTGLSLPASVDEAMARLEAGAVDPLLIVEADGKLAGAVSGDALREAVAAGDGDLEHLIQRQLPWVGPEDTLDSGLRKLAVRDIEAIPAVDGSGHVLGVVTRAGLLREYRNALAERERGSGPPPG
ncbi:MAG: chloride channel protein [Actinobacteria bacterium]|nr:chloride channel protein [Actinomycetota bacterium]